MRSSILSLVAVLGGAITVAAQPAAVVTPRIGFAYDVRLGAIRPIRGIPGAAILGDGIGGGNIAAAAISPRQNYALAQGREDRRVYFLRLDADSTNFSPVPGTLPDADRMVFSATGSAAALYSSSSGRLQILNGFDSIPEAHDVAAPAGNSAPVAIAISDDAQSVAIAFGGESGEVWWLDRGGAQRALPKPASALAFSRDGTRLLGVTPGGDVYLVRKFSVDSEVQTVYSGEPTQQTLAAAFAPTENRALTVNEKGVVAWIDLTAGSVSTLSCQCRPATLHAQSTETLFRLNDISNLPVMLIDISLPEPRLWFVPADPPAEDAVISTESARSRQ
jgi:hypothetical protein